MKCSLLFEGKFAIVKRKKNEFRDFYLLGSYPLVGRHVVNEPKVGCYVVSKLGKSLSRTLSGSFTCVYTRGFLAVEFLAKLSRLMQIFSKSFKAMILGFDFI